MDNAVFALVPCGNNMESYRFWQAIVAGAIPIQEDCGDPPHMNFLEGIRTVVPNMTVLTIRDWNSELQRFSPWVWTALALDRLQEQQMQWYALFKTRYEDLLRQSSAGPDDGPNPSL
jgi:hypothetical protein